MILVVFLPCPEMQSFFWVCPYLKKTKKREKIKIFTRINRYLRPHELLVLLKQISITLKSQEGMNYENYVFFQSITPQEKISAIWLAASKANFNHVKITRGYELWELCVFPVNNPIWVLLMTFELFPVSVRLSSSQYAIQVYFSCFCDIEAIMAFKSGKN